jgi:hypothetical protein
MAYRVTKHLNKEGKDTLTVSIIEEKQWMKHSKNWWHNFIPKMESESYNVEEKGSMLITADLEELLKLWKNGKSSLIELINIELLKCEGIFLKITFKAYVKKKLPKN